jgi:hypothetical protein
VSDGRRIGRPGRITHSFYGGEVRQYEDPRRVEVLFETRHWSPSHVTTTGARSQMGVAVGGEQWAGLVGAVTAELKASLDDALSCIERLSDERDELAAKHITASDLLRNEKERADAAIRREDVADEHFEEKSKECEALRKRLTDLETSAEYWSATAPGGSLLDDLKNTIVSQAREIARLKGESA